MWDTLKQSQFIIPVIAAVVAAFLPLLTFALSIYRNAQDRNDLIRQRQYEQYHELIVNLASNAKGFVDAQTAIAFELRHFRRYRKVTIRIFEGLIKLWENETKAKGLREEMRTTIEALKKWPLFWRLFYIFD